jgi:hypothetical protein
LFLVCEKYNSLSLNPYVAELLTAIAALDGFIGSSAQVYYSLNELLV